MDDDMQHDDKQPRDEQPQTDAEIIEQEKARTRALEYGQDEALEDAPRQDGDAATPSGPVP
jgi:hypothetical protein